MKMKAIAVSAAGAALLLAACSPPAETGNNAADLTLANDELGFDNGVALNDSLLSTDANALDAAPLDNGTAGVVNAQ